ncbi:MAG TPA: hypothetical protein VFV87_09110 [Pirellulaceae bacterium]|nr:hypothetical protein [Pirellulaceae bacterium]
MSDRGALASAPAAESPETKQTDLAHELLSAASNAPDRREVAGGAKSAETNVVAPSLGGGEPIAEAAAADTEPQSEDEASPEEARPVDAGAEQGRPDQVRPAQAPPTDASADAARQRLAERIAASPTLPPGLRTRLAEVAAAGGGLEQAVLAVEQGLPGVLRVAHREASRTEHPAGEVFFHGDAGAISDQQAETIAQGQLARSGLLRGQRVRVAAD